MKDVLTDQTTLLFTFYHGPHQISRDGGLSLSLGAGGATGVQPAATFAAMSPALPGVVYATFMPYGPGGMAGGGRSLDGGDTWEWMSGWLNWHLIALGDTNDSIYVSGLMKTLYRSNDGGQTYFGVQEFEDDLSALATGAGGTHLWVGLRSGVLWTSVDSGASWSETPSPPVSGYIRYLVPVPDEAEASLVVGELGDLWLYRGASPAPTQLPVGD